MQKLALAVLLMLSCVSVSFAQQTSAPVVLTISDPVPIPAINTLTSTPAGLVPQTISAGSAQFTLTVNGNNFISTSIVQWTPPLAGSPTIALVTTFASVTKLTAVVPASLISAKGLVNITVLNPSVVSQHGALLQWVASTTPGVGYDLWRSVNRLAFEKIASGFNGTTYHDTTAPKGSALLYYVVAVDPADPANPAMPSNIATAQT